MFGCDEWHQQRWYTWNIININFHTTITCYKMIEKKIAQILACFVIQKESCCSCYFDDMVTRFDVFYYWSQVIK